MSLRTDQIESWLESVDDYETGDWRPTKDAFEWLCKTALKGLGDAKAADRYRFLRNTPPWKSPVTVIMARDVGDDITMLTHDGLDVVIDQAMASQATPQLHDGKPE